LEAPHFLHKLGLTALEYAAVKGIAITEEKASALGLEVLKYDIALSLHAPYFINLCSVKREVVEASILRLIESIRAHTG